MLTRLRRALMRHVAAEAGVTPTALYRHFASKDALLREVRREVYRVFRPSSIAELPHGDRSVWLRLACDRYLRFTLGHPNYCRLHRAGQKRRVIRPGITLLSPEF